MKQSITLKCRVLVIALLIVSLPALFAGCNTMPTQSDSTTQDTSETDSDNPIDRAFSGSFDTALPTAQLNLVAEQYLNAWQAELDHVAQLIKDTLRYEQDKQRVTDYVTAVKSQASVAFDLELLNWSDLHQAPEGRSFGTGGPSAAMFAQADVYKSGVLHLIVHYESNVQDKPRTYEYLYQGSGPSLEEQESDGD